MERLKGPITVYLMQLSHLIIVLDNSYFDATEIEVVQGFSGPVSNIWRLETLSNLTNMASDRPAQIKQTESLTIQPSLVLVT